MLPYGSRRLKRHSSDTANNWPHVMLAFVYPAPGGGSNKYFKNLTTLNNSNKIFLFSSSTRAISCEIARVHDENT